MILRPYQTAALSACWDYLRNRPGNPALVLPAGAWWDGTLRLFVRKPKEQSS